jgi:hypothetical protein
LDLKKIAKISFEIPLVHMYIWIFFCIHLIYSSILKYLGGDGSRTYVSNALDLVRHGQSPATRIRLPRLFVKEYAVEIIINVIV